MYIYYEVLLFHESVSIQSNVITKIYKEFKGQLF